MRIINATWTAIWWTVIWLLATGIHSTLPAFAADEQLPANCAIVAVDAVAMPVSLAQLQQALDNADSRQAQVWFAQWPEAEQLSLDGQLIAARILAASDSKAAGKQLRALAELHPDNADILQQLGVISVNRAQQANMFSALGHAKDAVKYWQQALQIDPQHQRALLSLAMYYLGAPGIAGGDKEQAAALSERLLTLDAPTALALQAQILLAKEQPDEAIRVINDALQQHADAANLYLLRARWHADGEHWQPAFADLLQACETADNAYLRRSVQYQLGRLAVVSEQFLIAGVAALQAVHSAGDERYQGWTQLRLAQLFRLSGELGQARDMLALVPADSDDNNLRKLRKSFARELEQALAQPVAQSAEQVSAAGLKSED